MPMTIHREGYRTIAISAFLFGVINMISFSFLSSHFPWLTIALFIATLGLFLFLVSFFRIPNRTHTINEHQIICPADGKVVVIEEITDVEYFKDKRIQVSIFMSPANVHVNRNPMDGLVTYNQYHKGKYLVAWHPKSSTENERTTVVMEENGKQVLFRQIAGALARRIVCYVKPGVELNRGDEYGFIKFGSRIDLYLPLDTEILVDLNQKTVGGETIIAKW
jgi:phosphatidylserine decarboxylase